MRTIDELLKNNVDREDMSGQEHNMFVNYWFDQYEKGGFCETFESLYDLTDEQAPYKGKPYIVTGRYTDKEADLECLPMWRIRFKDGFEIGAYPEEICKIERNK